MKKTISIVLVLYEQGLNFKSWTPISYTQTISSNRAYFFVAVLGTLHVSYLEPRTGFEVSSRTDHSFGFGLQIDAA